MTLVMESKEDRPSATKAPMTPVASPPRPPFAPVESPPRPPRRVQIVSDPRVGGAKTTPTPEALPPLPPAGLPLPPCRPLDGLIHSHVPALPFNCPSILPNALPPAEGLDQVPAGVRLGGRDEDDAIGVRPSASGAVSNRARAPDASLAACETCHDVRRNSRRGGGREDLDARRFACVTAPASVVRR